MDSVVKTGTLIATNVAKLMCEHEIVYLSLHVGRPLARHPKNRQRWVAVVELPDDAELPESSKSLSCCTVVYEAMRLPVLFKPLNFNQSNIASQVFAHRIGFVDSHLLLPIPFEKLDTLSYHTFAKFDISFIAAVWIQNTLRCTKNPRPFTLF